MVERGSQSGVGTRRIAVGTSDCYENDSDSYLDYKDLATYQVS